MKRNLSFQSRLSGLARFASKLSGSGQTKPPLGVFALTDADWDHEHQLASGQRPPVKTLEEKDWSTYIHERTDEIRRFFRLERTDHSRQRRGWGRFRHFFSISTSKIHLAVIQGVLDPNKSSGVVTIFGLLAHALPEPNKRRRWKLSMVLSWIRVQKSYFGRLVRSTYSSFKFIFFWFAVLIWPDR
jgi:hypothetical protein